MGEAQIISGLRACSAEAHEALYDTYADGLYDYCHALLQDDAAAAVALRETLLHAAASTDAMPAGCSLRAWLYALARSQCRAGGERMIEHPMPDDDPSAHLLISVLGTLTARDREVLELTGRHALTEAELEPVLGLPPDRVASLLTDARRHFDQAMADELDRTGPVAYPSLVGITEGDDPLALLYRAIPRAVPPSGQRPRILDDLLIAGTTGTVPAAFTTAGPPTHPGDPAPETPGPSHARPHRKRTLLLGVTAAAIAVAAGTALTVTQLGGSSPTAPHPAAAPTDPTQPTVDQTTAPTTPTTSPGTPTPTTTAPSVAPRSRADSHHNTPATSKPPHSSHPPRPDNRVPGPTTSRPRPPATHHPPTHRPTRQPDPTPTPTPTPTDTPTTNSATPTG